MRHLILALICIISVSISNGYTETIEILDIEPVSGFERNRNTTGTSEAVEFDGSGIIFRVDQNAIVINDMLFDLSPVVSYHSADGSSTTKASFGEGKLVGYVLNSQEEILSLWITKED
jgi:hypothetical protein